MDHETVEGDEIDSRLAMHLMKYHPGIEHNIQMIDKSAALWWSHGLREIWARI